MNSLVPRPVAFAVFLSLPTFFLLTNVACKNATAIQEGSSVKINYTLTVDGEVIDSSEGGTPLPYIAGSGQIIPGLDEELIGLKRGDKKRVVVPPERGYGPLIPDAVQKISKKNFGETKGLQVGSVVTGESGGRPIQAKVVSIGKNDITLDMNHPLAGKTLHFDIEVVNVEAGESTDDPDEE